MAEKLARVWLWLGGVVRKPWFPGAALTLAMLAAFVTEAGPLIQLEYKLYDKLMSMRQVVPSQDVVLVGVDDYTVSRLGPAPRMPLAGVIKRLSKLGASVVSVDLLFEDKDINPALEELRTIIKAIGDDSELMKDKEVKGLYTKLEIAEFVSDADDALLKALKVKSKLVFPLSFEFGEKAGLTPPSYVLRHSIGIPSSETGFLRVKSALAALRNPLHSLGNPVLRASKVASPFKPMALKSKALGHRSIIPDKDGVVRRDRVFISYAGRLYPSLSLQSVLRYRGMSLSDYAGEFRSRGVRGLDFGEIKIPVDSDMGMLLSVSEPPAVFSFMDVLDGVLPEGVFKGKAVLIGDTSKRALRYKTSDGRYLTALELYARSVQDMHSGTQVVRPQWAFGLEFLVIVYFGVFISFILPRVRLKVTLLVMALSLLPLWTAAIALFLAAGYWLMVGSSTVFLVAGFAFVTGGQYVRLGGKSGLDAEAVESLKMLGLSFQGQGMLDMALEKLMRCPVADISVRNLLYNLALDFERKRMPLIAREIYEHILSAGPYKDASDRMVAATTSEAPARRSGPSSVVSDGPVQVPGGGAVYPTLGRYEIINELGRGAMGTVLLGRDPKINREVAIKTLLYKDVDQEDLESVKQRFFQEAEAAGRLSHPNIMTIFDVGEEHDLAFIAMEVLKGEDLKRYCSKEELLSQEETMRIVADVADALAYAHGKGVVHRDIKPANIMRLVDGIVKVTDFGIARVVESSKTQTGTVLGTPSYMSPEQVAGKKLTGPSDLFSLGAMFYELLSGEKPFIGESIATIMFNITKCKYASIQTVARDVPDCVAGIISKMLSKTLKHRYSDGAEVASAIRACLQSLPGKDSDPA